MTGVSDPVSISGGQTATAPTPPTLTGYGFAEWYTEEAATNQFDFSQVITANIDLYAKWNIQQFTITYHGNKPQDVTANVTGVSTTPVTVESGDRTTPPTDPTLADYNFVGWYTEATATNPFNFSQGITTNIDLYAKWSQDPVVTFDTQGGNNIESQTITGSVTMATRPDDPTRDDYTFDNWYTMATGGELFVFSRTINASITVYAQWNRIRRTITYRGNKPNTVLAGVSVTNLPDPVIVNSGDKTTAPTATPVLQDYDFQGWFAGTTSTTGTLTLESTAFAFETTAIKADLLLYAKWTRTQITVTFHGRKPSTAPADASITGLTTEPTIVTVNSGEITTALSPPPELTGYTLDGWYKGTVSTTGAVTLESTAFDFALPVRGENINLYTKWLQQFTVTYHGNKPQDVTANVTGVRENPVSVSEGQTATAPTPPTLTGYNFVAWYTEATATNQFDFSQGITTSIDLYAKWSQDPVVTFDTQGGSAIEPQRLTETPKRATRPQENPMREDYTFDNWYTMATGGALFDFDQDITAQSTTVYARWNRITRTVTYHGNKPDTVPEGVSVTNLPDPATVNVDSGDTATKPTGKPELQDYVFQGWYAGTTTGTTPMIGNKAFVFETTPITTNIDLYAKWTRKEISITFYGNKPSTAPEGATITGLTTDPTIVTVNSGETTTALAPELTGYTLDGWFIGTTSGGTLALQDTAFDFTTTTIRGENINLYAKWTKDPVVTFDTQGGSPIEPQRLTGTPKRAARPQENPTREDYTFENWYTMATGGELFVFSRIITASITVYAQWTRIEKTITYHGNKPNTVPRGVSVTSLPDPATVNVNSGDMATAPATPPELQDYVFQGWFAGTTTGTTPMIDNTAFVFETTAIKENKDLYAKWTRKEITITFYGNKPSTAPEGATITGLTTDPTIVTVNSGDRTTELSPALTGYTLDGWFIGTTSGDTLALQDTAFDFTTTIRGENINLYAKWTQDPVVTFDTQGGSTILSQTITYPVTMAARPQDNPTREGYVFGEWYTMATGGELFVFSRTITASITIYAQWIQQFTVTYHGNKPSAAPDDATVTGVSTIPVTVNSGDRTTTPIDPTLADYNFVAWYTEATATNQFDFSQGITTSIDLYAKWTQDPVVTFDTKGGSAIEPQRLTGTIKRATRPDNEPTREDYTFDNWYTTSDTGTTQFNFDQDITAQSTIVYARWNRIMRIVTYHGNKPDTAPTDASITGLTTDPTFVTVNSGDRTTPIPAPELEDYVFQGWFAGTTAGTMLNLENTAFAFETTAINEYKNLYAKWTRKEITISFYGNKPSTAPEGASITGLTTDPTIITVNSGETTTALTPPPELTGYTLDGWFIGTISGGTLALQDTAFAFTTTTIRGENFNLYAKWTKDPVVTFDTQGGTEIEPQTLTGTPKRATRPQENPTREGYQFVNWYTMATGGTLFDFSATTPITASITVYAQWLQQFTVTYHGNKPSDAPEDATVTGVSENPVSIAEGQTATVPTPPTLANYNFVAWYTEATATNQFNFSRVITANIDLYAKWSQDPVVTFDTQGGSVIDPQRLTGTIKRAARPDVNPSRTSHYTFKGWFTTATGTTEFSFDQDITAQSTTVFAQWTRNTYTITFNHNYGEMPATITRTTDQEGKVSPPDLSMQRPEGYTMIGWFKTNGGSDKIDDFATEVFNENITLYAKWVFRPETKAVLVAEINRAITDATPSPNLNYIDTSLINDMSELFKDKRSFNGDISGWNVSNVENMSDMFRSAPAFNGNISSWNVSLVENMSSMFFNASAFNGNISSWNVARVTNIESMFRIAYSFNGNISSWNVAMVNNMSSMFKNAAVFNGDISSWNVSKVTNMGNMFENATVFNGDISSWNVSKVTNMGNMFANASAFNGNISSWNVAKVSNMSSMFKNTAVFNGDISSWNVARVTRMSSMFYEATVFNQNISSWNVARVTNMWGMFDGAAAFNGNISSWNVAKVIYMVKMFRNTFFNQNISSWNVSRVKNMESMFNGATAFNQNISSWNVARVTNMSNMFNLASDFNGDISNWRPTALTTMANMFKDASAFTQNIESWNIASSVDKTDAFTGSGLASKLPSWAN